ncbi:MAG: hypothetical protein ABR562_01775 [Thermoplasmatota archaeon]|nr:hypothetical protein [Halobacteriales archaeon]
MLEAKSADSCGASEAAPASPAANRPSPEPSDRAFLAGPAPPAHTPASSPARSRGHAVALPEASGGEMPPMGTVAPLLPLAASAAALYSLAPATAAANSVPAALETVAARAGPALRNAAEALAPILAGRRAMQRPVRQPPRHEHLRPFPSLDGVPFPVAPVLRIEVQAREIVPFASLDGVTWMPAVPRARPALEVEIAPFAHLGDAPAELAPFAAVAAPPVELHTFPGLDGVALPAPPADVSVVPAVQIRPFAAVPGTWPVSMRPVPRRLDKVALRPFPPAPVDGRTILKALHRLPSPAGLATATAPETLEEAPLVAAS